MSNPNFIKAVSNNTGAASLWTSITDGLSGNSDTDIVAFAQLTPPGALSAALGSSGVLSGAYQYAVIFVTGYWPGATGVGNPQIKGNTGVGTASVTINPSAQQVNLSSIPIGPTGVVQRILARTKAGGSTFYVLTTINDNTTTTWTDNTADSSLTTPASTTNTTGGHFIGDGSQLTGITPSQVGAAPSANGIPYAVDTSTNANTLTVTLSPAPASYTDGMPLSVKVANTTTGAATLNVNGLGAIPIKNGDGTAVGSGDLVAGVPVTLRYVGGASPAFIASGSGGISGTGNATAADVRAPKTFTSSSGKAQTGTLVDRGNGPTVNPSTSTQTLAAGIYDTAITVSPVTGTATASQVLNGQTFSSASGINQTGSMPNQGSPTKQPGDSIQPGYYSGGSVAAPGTGSQTFTSSGTFTVPSGVTRVLVELWGGGGGGAVFGNNIAGGGNGGGGGGYTAAMMNVTPGQQISVTVGAGGSPGSTTGSNDTTTNLSGGNGGNSQFLDAVGYGGQGGGWQSGSNVPGNGGGVFSSSLSDGYLLTSYPGGTGGQVYNGSIFGGGGGAAGGHNGGANGGAGSSSSQGTGGTGGSGFGALGGGGNGGNGAKQASPTVPGGGAGGSGGGGGAAYTGQAGANGQVTIHW